MSEFFVDKPDDRHFGQGGMIEQGIDTSAEGKDRFEVVEALKSVGCRLPDKDEFDLGGVECIASRHDAITGHRFTEPFRPARLIDAGQMQ